jgi:fatty-acyl-CoA synthase
VVDDQGEAVPRDGNSLGEICARSNVVFKGYWEQPEETAKAIVDGWFHTGDLGVWDEVGNVHIADRKKDVIISGGENISSPEIEDALYQHPGVLECAVIGVPHEKWGETPCAIVVPREGRNVDAAELIAFCREQLAHFKCPTRIEVVEVQAAGAVLEGRAPGSGLSPQTTRSGCRRRGSRAAQHCGVVS